MLRPFLEEGAQQRLRSSGWLLSAAGSASGACRYQCVASDGTLLDDVEGKPKGNQASEKQ